MYINMHRCVCIGTEIWDTSLWWRGHRPHLALANTFPWIVDPCMQPPRWRNGVVIIEGLVSKVHTVQLLTKLPRPHSSGVHRHCQFMAPIATAGLSRLTQITYPAQCSGPTAVLPVAFMCLPTSPKYQWSITRPLLIDYPNTIYHTECLSAWLAPSWPITKLLRTHPDDADANPIWFCTAPKLHTLLILKVSCQRVVRLP